MQRSRPAEITPIACASLAVLALVGAGTAGATATRSPVEALAQGTDASEIRAYLARLADRGLWSEVVREGEAYLRATPRGAVSDVVRYRVGCARVAAGDDAGGMRDLEPLARRAEFEFAPESAVRCAEVAMRAGAPERAEAFLAPVEVRARGATRDAVRILRVRARLAAGRAGEAAQMARALRQDAGAAIVRREACLLEAWAELRSGRAEESGRCAAPLVDDAAASVDERAEARIVLGEALLDGGRASEARTVLDAVPAGPWRAAALRGTGFAQAALGAHADAARAFVAARDMDPTGARAVECALQAGVEFLAAGDVAAARKAFAEGTLDALPDTAEWRARAALAADDASTALVELDRASRTANTEVARRQARLRGEILVRAGRRDEAARAFAAGGDAAGLVEAARASLASGDASAALRHAQDALRTSPRPELELAAQIARGEAAFQLERWADARTAFGAARALETDRARAARIALRSAWSVWNAGDARAAAEEARSAIADLPEAEREEGTFLVARALETAGDPRAGSAWQAYVDRYPTTPRAAEAVLRLARTLPVNEARALLRRAAQSADDPRRAARIELELGELESRVKDYTAARTAYERALDLTAGSGRDASSQRVVEAAANVPDAELETAFETTLCYGLAFACAAQSDDTAAEHALAPLLAQDRQTESPLDSAARELAVTLRVRAQDADGAFARWRRFATASVSVDRALASLRPVADLLVRAGRASEVETALAGLAQRATRAELAVVEIERAWLAVGVGDARAAVAATERAARADTQQAALGELRLACGDALSAGGDAQAAESQYAAAAAANAGVLDRALVRLAWSRLQRGDDRAALADLERFEHECATSTERPRALALRGEALWRLDRPEECARVLTEARKSVRDEETRALVLARLGSALLATERWGEAADVLLEFTRQFPKAPSVPSAELDRGRALVQTGDTRGARSCFERALTAGGAIGARARLERARMAQRAGDLDAALSDALKAALLVDDPESSPEALELAAEVLDAQGEHDAARARRTELVARYPRTPAGVRASQAPAQKDGQGSKNSRGTQR